MRSRNISLLTFALGAILVFMYVAPAMAHHSFSAEFDSTKPVTKQGFVTKVEWTNPHVWFYIDVKNPDGSVTNWGFEMGPPHGLQAGGWKRDTMKLGDEVIVAGKRADAPCPIHLARGVRRMRGLAVPANTR